MADVPARTEIGVTTGPIRGSRKIHVGPLGVSMREIDLEPSCGEPPLRVYDPSGPYTDPQARIFPALKRAGEAEGLPTSLLIGPDGCVAGSLSGWAEWASNDGLALMRAATSGS